MLGQVVINQAQYYLSQLLSDIAEFLQLSTRSGLKNPVVHEHYSQTKRFHLSVCY